MALFSGYFNSINGDRKYNAETMSKYFSGIISKGVLQNYLNAFQVVTAGAMAVTVQSGRAYFSDGRWIENTTPINLTLDSADVLLGRIDRIVLRMDNTSEARNCSIIIKKGTAASSPVAPMLENTGSIEELSLAAISIPALTETVTQSNITDERPINSLCGFVHGLIEQVNTENLFAQYQAGFDEWFSEVKETLATATLIRQFNSHYTTTETNQTIIPINIPEYNANLDILNVFINGLKLIRGVDYLQSITDEAMTSVSLTFSNGYLSSEEIQLLKPLDSGQVVDFEVFKSVDGSDAETVVGIAYDLQTKVDTLEQYVYRATGSNDHVKLSNMCQAYFAAADAPDQMVIEVVGNNFTMGNAPVLGEGSVSNRYKWFNIGSSATDKRLTLDFSKCSMITLNDALSNSIIFFGNNVTVRNLKMKILTGTAVTFTENMRSEYYNCDIEMSGFGVMCFARCCGIFENNRIYVTSANGPAYCFEGTGVNFQRITGGIYYAYTGAGSTVSAPFYVPSSLDNNILLMTNCNCPTVARSGYYQSNSVKINSGKFTLIGNILGKATSKYNENAGAEVGTITANIAQ